LGVAYIVRKSEYVVIEL